VHPPDTRLPRLFRTASFRLAAFYAVTFGASVLILAVVVYFAATRALDAQIRERVTTEVAGLREEYAAGGASELKRIMQQRQDSRAFSDLEYALYDKSGKRVFGTLPPMPLKAGWAILDAPPDGDEQPGEDERMAVFIAPLKDNLWLFVGSDINRVSELGTVISDTFGWGLALSLTLAIAGGMIMSILFLRRVDTITRTAEAIIGGDIDRRIPLRGANDDIDRLSATLNRMLDRIAALMDTVGQVTNDIAHDLRTPIGRLRQSLEEARRSAANAEEFRAAMDRAIGETDSILDTFAALLRISQIEAGRRRAGFVELDLSVLVDEVCQAFGPAAEDAGKRFQAKIEPHLRAEGDRELLAQMLVNLIENAIAHTQAGAQIAVSLGAFGGAPVLSVSDNGPGIPADEHGRVFQRFYRLEQSRTSPGNGLGLSLVAAIAELHGVAVSLGDNAPGLTIALEFPGESAAPADLGVNAPVEVRVGR
jgi:signal transduction histidine kinase